MQKGKGKGSPYSITEHRVAELILVLGSQPAGDVWVINPAVGCHYFPPGPQLSLQPLRGLLPILLLGEQRHDGCEQFAQDCYPTALRLRFEPRPFCAWVQHANHSATKPPYFLCKHYINHKKTVFTFDISISNRDRGKNQKKNWTEQLLLTKFSARDQNVKGK